MDSAEIQKQGNAGSRNKNKHRTEDFVENTICLNGDLGDTSTSSSEKETSDVESSDQESSDDRSSSNTDLDILAEVQAEVLQRYQRKFRSQLESSLDSSDDESDISVGSQSLKKKSKCKLTKRVYSTRKSLTLESEAESDSSETSSSSVDSDDEKISDSFFEDSSDTGSNSDSEESTKAPSVDLNRCSPSDRQINTSATSNSDSNGLDQGYTVGIQNKLRSHSVPTLVNHAVENLRWPFTNLYVKELHVDSDESELEENQQEKETLSNYKTKFSSYSFPSRQKDIMLGRVWTRAWWAVNSGSPSELVNYKDVNSIGW